MKEVRSDGDAGDDAEEIAAQFRQECRILADLSHPGLPRIIDSWSEGSCHYLVMELVKGQTLQEILDARGGRLSFAEVFPWACDTLSILAYLHGQAPPIVFRDLKPANLMITPEGRVKMIDFGIARHFSPFKTQDTFVLGTPGFAAPEQYGKHQTDPRADLFSWAATFHYVLTGNDPEEAAFRFPPLHAFAPEVPRHFSDLLAKCLAYEPEKRPLTATHVLAAVEEEMRRSAGSPPARPSQTPPLSDRAVVFVALLGAVLLGMATRWLSPAPAAGSLAAGLVLAGALLLAFVLTPDLRCLLRHWWSSDVRSRAGVVASLGLLVALLAVPLPGGTATPATLLSECETNQRTLGVSCEMYAFENHGDLPASLDTLRPRYYAELPACPTASSHAYAYVRGQGAGGYTVSCTGSHAAAGVPAGFPQYSLATGIVK